MLNTVYASASCIHSDVSVVMGRAPALLLQRALRCFFVTLLVSNLVVKATKNRTHSDAESLRSIPLLRFQTAAGGTATGECAAGTVFTIASVADLEKQFARLDCIFAAGLDPPSIPLGAAYERTVKPDPSFLAPSLSTNALAEFFHFLQFPRRATSPRDVVAPDGVFFSETLCQGTLFHLAESRWRGFSVAWAVATLGSFPYAILQGDGHPLTRSTGLVLDFTIDLSRPCTLDNGVTPFGHYPFLFFNNHGLIVSDAYPGNLCVLLGRLIGRDTSDGVFLVLSRIYVRNPADPTAPLLFVGYTLLRVTDPSFDPAFAPGQSLPPLATSVSFTVPSTDIPWPRVGPLHYLSAVAAGIDTPRDAIVTQAALTAWTEFALMFQLLPFQNN